MLLKFDDTGPCEAYLETEKFESACETVGDGKGDTRVLGGPRLACCMPVQIQRRSVSDFHQDATEFKTGGESGLCNRRAIETGCVCTRQALRLCNDNSLLYCFLPVLSGRSPNSAISKHAAVAQSRASTSKFYAIYLIVLLSLSMYRSLKFQIYLSDGIIGS